MLRNALAIAATQFPSGWVSLSQMRLSAWFFPLGYFWFLTTTEKGEWQLLGNALALQLPVKTEAQQMPHHRSHCM